MSEVQLERGDVNIKTVVGIISGMIVLTVGFYSQVIIPIKEIQLGLIQVQQTLTEHNDKEETLLNKISELDKRVTALENKK